MPKTPVFQGLAPFFQMGVVGLSRRQQGFKSPWGRQLKNMVARQSGDLFCVIFEAQKDILHFQYLDDIIAP